MRDYSTLPRGKGKMKYSLTVYFYRKENEILFHTSEREGKNEMFLDRIFLPEGNERSFFNTSEREGKKIKESLTVCCAGRNNKFLGKHPIRNDE